MSSSRSAGLRRIAPVVIMLCAAGFATRERTAPPPLRPSVVLVLAIEGNYRNHLVDVGCTSRCDSVRRGMERPMRAALSAQYPFINWDSTAPAGKDTIVARWENVSDFYEGSRLTFVLREAGQALDSVAVDFEYDTIIARRTESDWDVVPLTQSWTRTLPTAVRGSDLLPRIFGRVGVHAAVDFSAPGDIFVPAHKDSIRAGSPHPVFELSVDITSPTLNIQDTGTALLTECNLALRSRGYTCPMRALTAGNRTFGAADVSQLRQAKSVKWRATRFKTFKPRAPTVGLSGVPQ